MRQRVSNHYLDERIIVSSQGDDPADAARAKSVMQKLELQSTAPTDSPQVGTLAAGEAIAHVVTQQGSVSLGQQMFAKANCAACHTVNVKTRCKKDRSWGQSPKPTSDRTWQWPCWSPASRSRKVS